MRMFRVEEQGICFRKYWRTSRLFMPWMLSRSLFSAKDHRGAYGTDGEYFSKPNVDSVVEAIGKAFRS